MKKTIWTNTNYSIMIKFFLAVIIFFIGIYNIQKFNSILVLEDEFGYWSIGAFLSGYDWSEVTSHMPYYSYGYSTVLFLLYKLFEDNTSIYRAAIFLNVIMLVCSYFLTSYCARKIFRFISEPSSYFIAFVVTLYANNIMMAKIAWTETMLYMMYWIITALLIKYMNGFSVINSILLGISSIGIYIVHQRNIGVFLSVLLTILVFTVFKKSRKNLGNLIVFIITVGILLVIHVKTKNYIVDNLWIENLNENSGREINDFAGQWGKLRSIFVSWNGFIQAIKGYAGKIFYVSTATLGLGLIGLYHAIYNIFKKPNANNDETVSSKCIYFFVSLSTILTLGVSTIFMLTGGRRDTAIYGRYTDQIMGVLLLFGIVCITYGIINKRDKFVIIIVMLICTMLANNLIQTKNTAFNFLGSPVVAVFYENGQVTVALGILTVLLLITLFAIYYTKFSNVIKLIVVSVISIIFWSYSASYGLNWIITSQETEYKKALPVAQLIDEDKDLTIHYLANSKTPIKKIEYLQFLLPKTKINYVTNYTISNYLHDLPDYVLILNNKTDVFRLLSKYDYIYEYEGISVLIPKGRTQENLVQENSNTTTLKSIGNAIDYSKGFFSLTRDNSKFPEMISNGTEGFFVYGPYISLEKGTYRIKLKLKVNETNQGEVGYLDIVSNLEEILKVNFDDGMLLKDGELIDEYIDFELLEDMSNIEFRIWLKEGVIATLEELNFQVLQ